MSLLNANKDDSVASTYGVFNSAAFDFRFSVLDDEDFRQSLPLPLQCQLTIQRFCARACRSIFDSPMGICGSRALRIDVLIDGLEVELTKIGDDLGSQMSGKTFSCLCVFLKPMRVLQVSPNSTISQRCSSCKPNNSSVPMRMQIADDVASSRLIRPRSPWSKP